MKPNRKTVCHFQNFGASYRSSFAKTPAGGASYLGILRNGLDPKTQAGKVQFEVRIHDQRTKPYGT